MAPRVEVCTRWPGGSGPTGLARSPCGRTKTLSPDSAEAGLHLITSPSRCMWARSLRATDRSPPVGPPAPVTAVRRGSRSSASQPQPLPNVTCERAITPGRVLEQRALEHDVDAAPRGAPAPAGDHSAVAAQQLRLGVAGPPRRFQGVRAIGHPGGDPGLAQVVKLGLLPRWPSRPQPLRSRRGRPRRAARSGRRSSRCPGRRPPGR